MDADGDVEMAVTTACATALAVASAADLDRGLRSLSFVGNVARKAKDVSKSASQCWLHFVHEDYQLVPPAKLDGTYTICKQLPLLSRSSLSRLYSIRKTASSRTNVCKM